MIDIDWKTAGSLFINGDCVEYMKTMPDKCVDLALVDPPYGVQYARGKNGWGACERRADRSDVKWDSATPDTQYFAELQRVSKYQIIWGGNYFTLPATQKYNRMG